MMTENLEQAIIDLIRCVYKVEYISKLKVNKLYSEGTLIGYSLRLSLNNDEVPLFINKEGTKEEFLKCIENELRLRHLNTTKYSLGYKVQN